MNQEKWYGKCPKMYIKVAQKMAYANTICLSTKFFKNYQNKNQNLGLKSIE